jgi:hypothetical protein
MNKLTPYFKEQDTYTYIIKTMGKMTLEDLAECYKEMTECTIPSCWHKHRMVARQVIKMKKGK